MWGSVLKIGNLIDSVLNEKKRKEKKREHHTLFVMLQKKSILTK